MADNSRKFAPKHGVGDRREYYDTWDSYANEKDKLANEEEEALKKEIEAKLALTPQSEDEKRDREKREALQRAKETWDGQKAREEEKRYLLQGETDNSKRSVLQEELGTRTVLVLQNNTDCVYHLPADLTLTIIFIEDCSNCTFELDCKLASSVIEVVRCENVTIRILEQPIHTIQVDLSKQINLFYAKDLFHSSINSKVYHSGVKSLRIDYDHLGTGVGVDDNVYQLLDHQELESVHDSLNPSSSSSVSSVQAPTITQKQFVTQYLAELSDLVTDLVLRDARGHPTTHREIEARKRVVEEAVKSRGLDINQPEVQKVLHEYDPVTPLDASLKAKEKGNEAFKERDYGQAAMHYTEAVEILRPISESENWGIAQDVEHEGVQKGREILCASLSNRAACSLKLGDHENALTDADACIALDPAHVKALFRKGLALHAMGRCKEACPFLGKALSLSPDNKQIKQALLFAERKAAMPSAK